MQLILLVCIRLKVLGLLLNNKDDLIATMLHHIEDNVFLRASLIKVMK